MTKRPSKRPSFRPLKEVHRLEAREIGQHDEILVSTGGYSRVTSVGFHKGKILVETDTGERTLMAPDTVVAVRR